MIIAYIILVLVIYYLVSRKKRKNNLSASEEPKKEDCITVFSKIIVAIFVVYMGFIVFMADVLVVDYWVFFGKKRTAEIESMYGIIVDDDIKLKNYKVTSWMEGKTRSLEFESDIDGSDFMKKNCKGELLQCEEYEMSENYLYEYQGIKHNMIFYSEGDSYRVKIY